MADRTCKFLLTVIALLLLALLVRPAPTPAQAQANAAPAPAQMAVGNGAVYLLQSGRLSVYMVETKESKKLLSSYGLGGPVTLRRVATQDVTGP